MVKVSVIIPCHNQGQTLLETLNSVEAQNFREFEVIVVDDGSTDPATRDILHSLNKPKSKVIHTANQGLATARNNGIREACGEYVLPLDADDRIGATYLEKAVAVLDDRSDVGIVYCRAETFGEVQGSWKIPEYSLEQMLLDNIIFCTAMFRKKDWEKVGGYDPDMVYGWEDYDFWLSLIERGAAVYQIPEVLFFYRVAADSMVRTKTRKQKVEMFAHIFYKHQRLYTDHIEVWIDSILTGGEKDREIDRLADKTSRLEEHIADRKLHIARLEAELDHLKNAKEWKMAWRLARLFWKLRRWLPGKEEEETIRNGTSGGKQGG